LDKCKRIITVSDFELDNIVRKLPRTQGRIERIYNGYNDWFKPTEDTQEVYKKYIPEKGYFFFLGNTDPKKNTERTLVAYSKYLEQSAVKRKLLMADLDANYLNDIIVRNKIENIREHIVMPGYIVNSDLITSNTSSMPEIGGPDAILVNPEKSDAITEMMLRLENDAIFYQKQKEIGIERAKLFSWRRTAEQLHQLYHSIK